MELDSVAPMATKINPVGPVLDIFILVKGNFFDEVLALLIPPENV